MDPWVWAVLLLVLGLSLAILEVFFPSAGILGFLSATAILAAIIMGFRDGQGTGFVILLVAVGGLPGIVILAFKVWPHTAIGRRVLLIAPSSEDVLPQDARKEFLKGLVGRVGKAKSQMLPSGAVSIDGHTVNAVSEGVPIEPGQAVRVIEVRGYRVVVRKVEDETPSPIAQDPLRRPIDSIAPDPFAEDRPS